MRETMAYRRQILLMEWEHQELKMIIEDIENQLSDIESVRVSITFQPLDCNVINYNC